MNEEIFCMTVMTLNMIAFVGAVHRKSYTNAAISFCGIVGSSLWIIRLLLKG